ncbi:MAG: hypothetical protein J7L66_00065 [Anaerolineaceae bacterium]|nr:hypothetical protein [Anaerolineaceae bacterium]
MKLTRTIKFAIIIGVLSLFIVSCENISSISAIQKNLSLSETVFEVTLPEPINDGEKIFLEVIDEVTGIALNPSRYDMQKKDAVSYYIRIPIVNGSIFKYRYVKRSNTDLIEKNPLGEQIYYRVYLVSRPAVVEDYVSSWNGEHNNIASGEISGYVYDSKTSIPLSEIFISINGITTTSSSDGFYKLKNIPVGQYNLTAFHPDGQYEPFQQGAVIAENAVTPASFGLDKAPLVNVSFQVTVPKNTPLDASIRFIGDKSAFGNVFTQLDGGTSIIPSRAPLMKKIKDFEYEINLELPAGSDLRYKFTMGDGFINAEHLKDGQIVTRQLIVPSKDITIKTSIESWFSSSEVISPINFVINSTKDIPDSDTISIQFNPFMWMQPIPMWKIDTNQWSYSLFGPFEYLDEGQFRFCRNDQCGYADDDKTTGKNASGFILEIPDQSADANNVIYSIDKWAGVLNSSYTFEKEKEKIKRDGYLKGIGFTQKFDPKWLPYLEWGYIDAAVAGANTIIVSPSWDMSPKENPTFTFNTANNPTIKDLELMYSYAQDAKINLVLYPQPSITDYSSLDYWAEAGLSYNWWIEWFSQYERFLLNYANYAQKNHISGFIIGGNVVAPALPHGRLPSGIPSNTPYDFSEKWESLINKIRSQYSGTIIFSLQDNLINNADYQFVETVDAILVESQSALTNSNNPTVMELKSKYAQILDKTIYPIYSRYNKPIIIGINYASIDGSSSNCIDYDYSCADLLDNNQFNPFTNVDLNEQADIYTAILDTVVEREWISGVMAMGYYPAVIVHDNSTSIHGKPAMNVLSYYFNNVISNE